MATSSTYLDELITKSNAAAAAKKDALDRRLQLQTTAQVDEKGNITYAKDTSGQDLYGSMDVDYMRRKRGTEAGAEATGMLRSGQYARALAEGQAAYRADIIGAKEQTEAEKTLIGEELATEQAKYKAEYGGVGQGVGGGAGGGAKSKRKAAAPKTPGSSLQGITPMPTLPSSVSSPYQTPRGFEESRRPTISRPKPVVRRPGQPVMIPGGKR